MKKKDIDHIASSYYNKIKKYLKETAADFDSGSIHGFRVTYKKLRAFLRMLSKGKRSPAKLKISNRLKKCYHITGTIRDMQLQQQRIEAISKQRSLQLLVYLSLLQNEIDKLKPLLAGLILQDPVKKSKMKTLKAIDHKLSSKAFSVYAKSKWEDVNSIITGGSFNDTNIHEVRKDLKDLYYNQKEFKEAGQPAPLHNIKKANRQKLDSILDELGNFQDRKLSISLLKPAWLKKLNRKNRQILEQIKKEWAIDKEAMKQSLVVKLRNDLINN